MNWKRGLFRVWVVVSVVWVALAYLVVEPVTKWKDASAPTYFRYQDVSLEFPSNTPRAKVQAAIATFIRTEKAKKPIRLKNLFDKFDPTPEQEASDIIGPYEPRSRIQPVVQFFAMAASIPLLLLLSAFVVLWVSRGFRRADV